MQDRGHHCRDRRDWSFVAGIELCRRPQSADLINTIIPRDSNEGDSNVGQTHPEKNKALVLEAFDTLFKKARAETFWFLSGMAHRGPGAPFLRYRDGQVQT